MMNIMRVGVLVSICISLLSFKPVSKEPVGKITFPLNRVFVIPEGKSQLQMAYFNMDVFTGDKIETKRESRCEITLRSGDVTRIDENSIYTLEEVEATKETVKATSFLSIGRLWSTIRKVFSSDDYVQVKSPSAVIAVRGTIYRVDVEKDSSTSLRVYDGEVEVSPYQESVGALPRGQIDEQQPIGPPTDVPGPTDVAGPRDVSEREWLEIIKAQQQIVIKADGSFQRSDFDPIEDGKSNWVQWNKKRDELLQR